METSRRPIADSGIRVTNLFFEISIINILNTLHEMERIDKSMENFFRERYSSIFKNVDNLGKYTI